MELSMKVFRSRSSNLLGGWAPSEEALPRARPSRSDLAPPKAESLRSLLEERLILREQVENLRGLVERLIARNDEKHDQVLRLEAAIRDRNALVADLESENLDLIRQLSAREDRIAALKSFLERIAGPGSAPVSSGA